MIPDCFSPGGSFHACHDCACSYTLSSSMKLVPFLIIMALTVLTLNVNGLRDSAKRAGIFWWLRALPSVPDVVCLQEVHCASLAKCQAWFLSSGFEFSMSTGTVKSAGCRVLFHPPLSLVTSWTDSDWRYLHLEFLLRGLHFRVACIYAPNRNPERDLFLTYVADNRIQDSNARSQMYLRRRTTISFRLDKNQRELAVSVEIIPGHTSNGQYQ